MSTSKLESESPLERGKGKRGQTAGKKSSPSAKQPKGSAELEQLQELQQQLEDKHNSYIRVAADFENFKKRKAQEFADWVKYTNQEAIGLLLPALDNAQRAVGHLPADADESFINGIKMIVREIDMVLSALGAVPINEKDVPFDPAIHEAVLAEDSDTVQAETVVSVLQPGYKLHDRVIRPAMVKIARPIVISAESR